jgi:hypothetical protein
VNTDGGTVYQLTSYTACVERGDSGRRGDFGIRRVVVHGLINVEVPSSVRILDGTLLSASRGSHNGRVGAA